MSADLTPRFRRDYAHKEIAGLFITVNFPPIKGRFGFLVNDGSLAYGSISIKALDRHYRPLPGQFNDRG